MIYMTLYIIYIVLSLFYALVVAGRHESDRILTVFTWVHCMLLELYTYSSCIPMQASIHNSVYVYIMLVVGAVGPQVMSKC